MSYDDDCIYAFSRDIYGCELVKNYACIVLSNRHAMLFAYMCIRARHVAACECTSVQVLWLPLPLLLPDKPGSGSEVTWLEKPINNLCVVVEADNEG